MSIYTRDAAARSEHTQTGWPHSPPQSESGRCAQQCAQGQSGHVVTSRRCRRGDAAAEVSRQCELHHRYQRHATHVRKARSMILADRLIVLGTHSRRSGACHHVASTIQQNLPRVLWSCSAISEFGICRAAHLLDPWPKSTLAGRYSFSDSPARALCDWHDARAYQFAAAVSLNIRRRVVLR